MIVLVTGGRDYSDRSKLNTVLDGMHARMPFDLLIHGGAPGADNQMCLHCDKKRVYWRYH